MSADPPTAPGGLVIAAPASGSGKTTVTLGLLRALARAGRRPASAKVGPDYIDPVFHAAASGRACLNLDSWAMRRGTIGGLLGLLADGAGVIVCEGVMGLFDGATADAGSTADVAALTGWPVVLVCDVRGQAASAAAVVRGFAGHRDDVRVAGVLFNRVGGARHRDHLADAMRAALPGVPVLGYLPAAGHLELPSRHLGLVQAAEHPALDDFLDRAADWIADHADVDALAACARPAAAGEATPPVPLDPPGQRVAVATDAAFAFRYPATLEGWRRAGAEVLAFSPLADEPPPADADAVYLPGGYPELHAGRLAGNERFLGGLRAAAGAGQRVFGECGGYMVMGAALVDEAGGRHAMAGLLPLVTSFAERRLHLGYRRAVLASAGPLGREGAAFRGHEFHYASILDEGPGEPLFRCADARGNDTGPAGLVRGRVAGSFVHLIDREAAP